RARKLGSMQTVAVAARQESLTREGRPVLLPKLGPRPRTASLLKTWMVPASTRQVFQKIGWSGTGMKHPDWNSVLGRWEGWRVRAVFERNRRKAPRRDISMSKQVLAAVLPSKSAYVAQEHAN